jgi:hypothetical protein
MAASWFAILACLSDVSKTETVPSSESVLEAKSVIVLNENAKRAIKEAVVFI